ncbi:tol-pal system YbgF family protein [Bacteroidota bacterium]
MKTRFFIILLSLFVISSCNQKSERDIEFEKVSELEEQLYGDTLITEINHKLAAEMVQAYVNFSEKFTEDSLAPEFLYKAAEISMNLNQGNQAILYFETIKLKYQNFNKIPECLFLQAFIHEDQLNNQEKATELYNQFMVKYPNHDLFDDAQISVQNMGKSLEEILEGFKQKENN